MVANVVPLCLSSSLESVVIELTAKHVGTYPRLIAPGSLKILNNFQRQRQQGRESGRDGCDEHVSAASRDAELFLKKGKQGLAKSFIFVGPIT